MTDSKERLKGMTVLFSVKGIYDSLRSNPYAVRVGFVRPRLCSL